MTDASQTHTLESALAEIDELKAQLAVQGKAWLTAELDLKAQLNAERETMNRTARTIIAVLRGNGGWLGLGNSEVESAVASYMQASSERIAKEANRAAEMEAQANQERERADAERGRWVSREGFDQMAASAADAAKAVGLMEAERDEWEARADALSRSVAEMKDVMDIATKEGMDCKQTGADIALTLSRIALHTMGAMETVLSRPDVTAEAGRWHSDEDIERFVAHRIATDPALRAVFLERDDAAAKVAELVPRVQFLGMERDRLETERAKAIADVKRCFLFTLGDGEVTNDDSGDVRGVHRNVTALRADLDAAIARAEKAEAEHANERDARNAMYVDLTRAQADAAKAREEAKQLRKERDEARAWARQLHRLTVDRVMAKLDKEQFVVDATAAAKADAAKAREEADALGLQVTALRERVRLGEALADAADKIRDLVVVTRDNKDVVVAYDDAFDAYRAVPGDVLAKT